MRINQLSTKLEISEGSALVRDLRHRYQKGKRKWRNLDLILEYVRKTDEEYRNSKPPAVGYEAAVWRTCTSFACNMAGKCIVGSKFLKDAWNLPREKGEMAPKERLELFLGWKLDPRVCVKAGRDVQTQTR